MRFLANWIKRNYQISTVLLLIISILLLVTDIYFRSNRTFDDVRFNNIITPSAAIISVVLFVYLTLAQLRIQVSNNLRQNFEERFEQLRKELTESIRDRVLMPIGIPLGSQSQQIPDINSLDYHESVYAALDRISADSNFIQDHTDFLNNRDIRVGQAYLRGRTYFRDLSYVLVFSAYPTFKYWLIENFLDEVISSRMVESDLIHFKKKVESLFLRDYFNLVMHRGGFELPNFHDQNPNGVPWQQYRSSGLERFFISFRQKLSS